MKSIGLPKLAVLYEPQSEIWLVQARLFTFRDAWKMSVITLDSKMFQFTSTATIWQLLEAL
jgi:hypothetical protein